MSRPRIALLSNPKSTGNIAQLARIREYCADHPDIFHYEVERADQISDGMRIIARVRPKMLIINGGDGTVQAALTEIHNGGHFEGDPPPVAVLPNGKTNLIAIDLGSHGDPIEALGKLVKLAQSDLSPHIVARELIALRCDPGSHPVIGMFLGGAGLADTMIYCRNKIYPLGLPNGVSHTLTAAAFLVRMFLRLKAGFLPPEPSPMQVSIRSESPIQGRFAFFAVTTLEKMLLGSEFNGKARGGGRLRLVAVEERPVSLLKAVFANALGKLGASRLRGVHFEESDEISIEGENTNLILDGEMFQTQIGRPIFLSPAQPLSFVRLAA